MEITPREQKLIERMRKQERQWPRVRWVLIGVGTFAVFVSGFTIIELRQHIDSIVAAHDDVMSRGWLLVFALLWPKSLMLFGLGIFFIAWAIRDWHGNPNRVLLLRLLEAQQKKRDM